MNAVRPAKRLESNACLFSLLRSLPDDGRQQWLEALFERPRALRARHPNLYAELRRYFRQDPVEFSAEAAK